MVPLSEDQAAAERSATLAVDVREAVSSCAPDLVVPSALMEAPAGKANGDDNFTSNLSLIDEMDEILLPQIMEIKDVRDFKHRILFPNSHSSN